MTMRTAVILAAGSGSRLGSLTGGLPKAWLKLGGCTLLERAGLQFASVGVERVLVVCGHRADEVRKLPLPFPAEFVVNPFFAASNTLASLWFALQSVREGFFLLNGDTVVSERLMGAIAMAEGEMVLACAPGRCAEEEVKYVAEEGRIVALGKEVCPSSAHGEFIGLSRIGGGVVDDLRTCAEKLLRDGQHQAYFEKAFSVLLEQGRRLECTEVGGEPWCEIDFPEDYELAHRLFGLAQPG